MPGSSDRFSKLHLSTAICRRQFIQRAAFLTGIFDVVASADAFGQSQPPTVMLPDPSLESVAIAYRSDVTMTMGHMARPRAEGTYPAIIVIHDTGGLNDSIRDVARRAATAGYIVVAPDFLSRLGGTAGFRGDEAEVARATGKLTMENIVADTAGAIAYLRTTRKVKGKIGIIGFGWGGRAALLSAIRQPELSACVMFDGDARPDIKLLTKLNAPVLAVFAGDDSAAKEGIPALEEALKKTKIQYEVKVYPGTRPGFYEATSKERYNADAAKDAWTKTMEHFERYLKGGSS